MIKHCLFSLVLLCSLYTAKADHITGGEMFYVLTGKANGEFQYSVTMKLFMRCNSGRQFNNPSIIGVFQKRSTNRLMDIPGEPWLGRKRSSSRIPAGVLQTLPPFDTKGGYHAVQGTLRPLRNRIRYYRPGDIQDFGY